MQEPTHVPKRAKSSFSEFLSAMKFVACAQLGAAHLFNIGPIVVPGQSLREMTHLARCAPGPKAI
jgi:hypothetical protein